MNKIKKSLLMSAISLLLCISMLIGSTFAWFTDEVVSSGNKIQSGTLNVDLELLDKETGKWNSLKESQDPIFNYDKWEPGYVDTKILKVENEGNLALKWVAKFYSEKQLSILADVIDVYVRPSDSEIGYPADRNLDGYACVGNLRTFINSIEETTYGTLEAKEVSYLGIALKMREEAGNDYQNLSLGGAFDIRIFATQHTSEADSFGNMYDILADESIVAADSKTLTEGDTSIEYSLTAKGVDLASVDVPADAILDPSKPVTVVFDGIDPEKTVEVGENTKAFAFDISVTNLKGSLAPDQLITVVVAAPKGLPEIKAYHNGVLIPDAVYDEVAGTITFRTANFSPFAFAYTEIEVESLKELREKATTEKNVLLKLTKDISINLSKGSTDRSEEHKTASAYYNAVNIVGENIAIDLNGKKITVECGTGYKDNSDVGALFYVGPNGSLNIIDNGKGGYIKMASSIYAVWAPYADPSYVDIFGGIFIADSYAGDPVGTALDSNGKPDSVNGTMSNEQENANRALIYAGTGGNINVHGGYFLYNNTLNDGSNRNNGAFNAKDYHEDSVLIKIHGGVMLINNTYRQDPDRNPITNPSFDDFSINLANGCKFTEEAVSHSLTVDGKTYSNWYMTYSYKITFMDEDGTVLDTQYIGSNLEDVLVSDYETTARGLLDDTYAGDNFGGWVNAASEPISKIDAGKTTDIVLYPKHADKYTVRWLNEDGKVIHSVITTRTTYRKLTAPTNPISKYDDMKFSHWEVRKVVGDTITSEAISDSYTITSDITLYPVYEYTGGLNLIPVDTDGDGVANHYAVAGSDLSQGEDFVIPEIVNGIKVEEIRTGAFADEDLRDVVVPKSITYIGKNAFCADKDGFIGLGGTYPMIQIIFEGTKADWDAIQKDTNWADNIGDGSNLVCLGDSTPCYYNKKNRNANSSWDMKTGYPDWFKERYPEWAN
jgi:predicted ribosomally synthesized peptide with SipW-like signal peptide